MFQYLDHPEIFASRRGTTNLPEDKKSEIIKIGEFPRSRRLGHEDRFTMHKKEEHIKKPSSPEEEHAS